MWSCSRRILSDTQRQRHTEPEEPLHHKSKVPQTTSLWLCVCSRNIPIALFVQLMHKQQFCVEVVPELVSRFNSAAPGKSKNQSFVYFFSTDILQARGSTS